MFTNTQIGQAGEELFAGCVTLTSNGDLELFKPLIDDDHTDISAGERGKLPALAIQVKTALSLDRQGLAVAKMYFPASQAPREHAAFIYAVLYVVDAAIQTAWIVPSADFNRFAYRGKGPKGKGLELEFMASPTRQDKWAAFRCTRLELGSQLIRLIDGLPPGPPPRIAGAHLLLRKEI